MRTNKINYLNGSNQVQLGAKAHICRTITSLWIKCIFLRIPRYNKQPSIEWMKGWHNIRHTSHVCVTSGCRHRRDLEQHMWYLVLDCHICVWYGMVYIVLMYMVLEPQVLLCTIVYTNILISATLWYNIIHVCKQWEYAIQVIKTCSSMTTIASKSMVVLANHLHFLFYMNLNCFGDSRTCYYEILHQEESCWRPDWTSKIESAPLWHPPTSKVGDTPF